MKKLIGLAIVISALIAAGCSAETNSNTYSNANASRTDAANTAAREKGEAVNSAGATISDATITSKIKVKFVADGIVGTNVDTVNGEVTLKGTVDDDAEKAKAEKIAKETEGVKSVKNELTIEKK